MMVPAFIWGWQKGRTAGNVIGSAFRESTRLILLAIITHAKEHFITRQLDSHIKFKK